MAKQIEEKKNKGKLIKDENDEEIRTTLQTYKNYFGIYWGGAKFIVITCTFMMTYCFCSVAGDYVVGDWSNQKD